MDKAPNITIEKILLNEIKPMEDEKESSINIEKTLLSPIKNIQDDEKPQKVVISLSGKLITSEDPISIGDNFRQLTNMRYTDTHPRSIGGMTKVNSAAIINETYFKTRSAYHMIKEQPAESHVLVQAYNTGLTASKVYENSTAIGAAGSFTATELWTDSSGFGVGQFSEATEGQVLYCNGVDTCIYGGNEIRCARFLSIDPNGTFLYDYTEQVNNTKSDALNVATLAKVTTTATVYVGSLRPLSGVKFYVSNANATAATAAASYWDGSAWQAVSSLVDGTVAVSGKTLSGTGVISFASTTEVAKVSYVDGTLLYFYKFVFTSIDAGVTIYQCTLQAPFQRIVDIWDGVDRVAGLFYVFKTAYEDYTLNIYNDSYDIGDPSTFVEVDSLASASGYMLVGFTERMCALNIFLVPSHVNSTASTTMTVSYWNGSAWATVGTIVDGTSASSVSLAKSGTVSWSAPVESSEFTQSISNGVPLYYYKINFSQNLSADVQVYHIDGIPAQNQVRNFKFAVLSENRVLLCNNMDWKKNLVKFSAVDTSQVFNGDDSGEFEFGDETALNCGCSLFSQLGSNMYNLTMLFKDSEIWILVFNESWIRYRISDTIGCPAQATLCTAIIPPSKESQGINKYLAIWQSYNGIYVSDGRNPMLVSEDISDCFDRRITNSINPARIRNSVGFMDEINLEYHWLFSSGTNTTHDREMVFDLKRWKWYEIDRSTGGKLQYGISVKDTSGNAYNYGFLDTGYMEALEWFNTAGGVITTFDGTNITSTLYTGDRTLADKDPFTETSIDQLLLYMVTKATTTNNVTCTHYIDTKTSGTDYTIDPTLANYRAVFPVKISNSTPGIFHAFKFVMITSNETVGFEPLLFGVYYKPVRDHNYVTS